MSSEEIYNYPQRTFTVKTLETSVGSKTVQQRCSIVDDGDIIELVDFCDIIQYIYITNYCLHVNLRIQR